MVLSRGGGRPGIVRVIVDDIVKGLCCRSGLIATRREGNIARFDVVEVEM